MKILWTEQALADLNQSYNFIAIDNENAAKKFAELILESIEQIKKFPESGRMGRVSKTRELIIPKISFILVYQANKESLNLIAVLHSSRKWPS